MNTIFKRVVSLFLGFVLIAGLLPVSVLATDYSIVVDNERPNDGRAENDIVIDDQIIASDEVTALQNAPLDAAAFLSDVHGSTSDLQSTLPGLNTSGIAYSSISFLGDTMLTMATVEGIVDGVLTNDPNILYVCAPKHDNYENDKEAGDCDIDTKWGFSGLALETEHYYVYTVYEPHMQYYNQESADAAQAFIDWANAETTDHSKPVFVISHRPMHQRRYENLGAFYWYDALTEVADQMDVFFLWGHNHYQENATLDVNAYYVAKDGTEKLIVQGPTQYENKSEVPNFTYMCAGYLNANKDVAGNSPRRLGLIVTAEIYADKIVFQDYTKDGAYTGSNSNNYYHIGVEVPREFAVKAPTLDTLTISGQTEYFVGDELALTVTAAYSDGTSLDVTKEATITGYDMSKAGTYTVTATYEGKTATIQITVEEEVFEIPEDYALNRIEVTHLGDTKYYLGEELDVSGLTVTAVYTKKDADDIKQRIEPLGGDVTDGYTVSSVDMTTTGKKYVTISYGGKTGAFTIEVSLKSYTNEAGDVTVEFSNHGVTSATVTVTVKEVEGYNAYVTYDITPVGYTQGDEATVTVTVDTSLFDASHPVAVLDQGKVIAVANIVDGKITFTTNHFSEYDVAQVDTSDATVDPSKWIEVVPATGGTTTYTYTRVNSITPNGEYVIVANNAEVALDYTVESYGGGYTYTSMTGETVDVSNDGTTMTATSQLTQWKFNNASGTVTISNGDYTLGYSSSMGVGTDRTAYVLEGNSNNFIIKRRSSNTGYALYYNDGWTTSGKNTVQYVRLYQLTKTETSGGTGATYGQLLGATKYQVALGTDEPTALQTVKNGMTVYWTNDNTSSTGHFYEDDGTGMSWVFADGYNPNVAGTYTVTIKYNNVTLGTATVEVVEKTATSVVLDKIEVTVERGIEFTDAKLRVTWDDGTTSDVVVTADMLEGDFDVNKNGTYTGLTVKYNGITAKFNGKDATNFILHVVNKTGPDINDFPEYPNPGSIDVDKSATGIDFQNTGAARVELSTSGLPALSGADVIIMLDTSSSMTKNNVSNESGENLTRAAVLEQSLANLIQQFKTSGPGGTPLDVNVAIADFNGYYGNGLTSGESGTPYDRTSGDYVKYGNNNGSGYNQPSEAKVYTGTGNLTSGAFIKASALATTYTLNYTSGTNYDYAFDAIYQLGTAIKVANGETQRPLYVIFMSDGASLQWNYFGTQNGYTKWNSWLTGLWKESDLTTTNLNSTTHKYFYDLNDHDGDGQINEHRMANAIKGDPEDTFEIIRKSTDGLPSGTLTPVEGKEYMYTVHGLGATMFTINFDAKQDGQITEASIDKALASTATDDTEDTKYYYKVTTAKQLENAFKVIGTEIAYAATNARFVDQMGSSFNLQFDPWVPSNNSEKVNEDGKVQINTDITITTHNIYTKDDAPTTDDIGKPYGNGTPMETVSFDVAEDGTVTATSSALTDSDNIMNDGVICAKYFFYNTNSTPRNITLADGSTYNLPAETFYWNIGIINNKQWTLSYTVMLEGALEGDGLPAGGYATNNFAILYYDNHVGNEVSKSVASPTMAWEAAQVSYAFYLVNDAGEPVYADGTKADSFLLAHRVTQPVVYKSVELNKQGGTTLDASALAVLPAGYELFAPDATYTVYIRSGAGGSADTDHPSSWTITGDDKATTYVMGYAGATDYSKAQSVNDESYNYTNTTVYFAVKWNIGTVPDTVVIDYGLDVDINVIANDMFGKEGALKAVGMASNMPTGHGTQLASGFNTTSVTGQFGTASIVNGKIRYSLDKAKGTAMNDAEYLAYAVYYKGSSNPGYYYGVLTIIPATTVYYEDEYVTLATYNANNEKIADGWPTDSVHATAIQGEDRPGQHNLGTIDDNNIYGYDSAYDHMSMFSMGSAAAIHVDSTQYGTAQFDFYGTGFDVFAVTSNTTGTLVVQVFDEDGNAAVIEGKPVSYAVDTYYGYTYGLYEVVYQKINGLWTLVSVGAEAPEGKVHQSKDEIVSGTPNPDGTVTGYQNTWKAIAYDSDIPSTYHALYQVPVMKIDGLPYGKYTAKITALYYEALDNTAPGGYDLYLDAIRIHNPAGTDADLGETIKKAYAADGELYPSYHELRNLILKSEDVHTNLSENAAAAPGIVFIDGNATLSDATGNNIKGTAIADYTNFGPNNELYLASKQAVAFFFQAATKPGYVPVVRIGMKTVGGKAAVAELWNVSGTTKLNAMSKTIETATEMYYDISVLNGGTIVITNSGEAGSILSITDIKVTYKSTEASAAGIDDITAADFPAPVFYINSKVVEGALETLLPDRVEKVLQATLVDDSFNPVKHLKPATPGKPAVPALPELPTNPVKPVRPAGKPSVAVSFEETVVRNRRVLG